MKSLDHRLTKLESKLLLMSTSLERDEKIISMMKFLSVPELQIITDSKGNAELENTINNLLTTHKHFLKSIELSKKEKMKLELLSLYPLTKLRKIANGDLEEIKFFEKRLNELLET